MPELFARSREIVAAAADAAETIAQSQFAQRRSLYEATARVEDENKRAKQAQADAAAKAREKVAKARAQAAGKPSAVEEAASGLETRPNAAAPDQGVRSLGDVLARFSPGQAASGGRGVQMTGAGQPQSVTIGGQQFTAPSTITTQETVRSGPQPTVISRGPGGAVVEPLAVPTQQRTLTRPNVLEAGDVANLLQRQAEFEAEQKLARDKFAFERDVQTAARADAKNERLGNLAIKLLPEFDDPAVGLAAARHIVNGNLEAARASLAGAKTRSGARVDADIALTNAQIAVQKAELENAELDLRRKKVALGYLDANNTPFAKIIGSTAPPPFGLNDVQQSNREQKIERRTALAIDKEGNIVPGSGGNSLWSVQQEIAWDGEVLVDRPATGGFLGVGSEGLDQVRAEQFVYVAGLAFPELGLELEKVTPEQLAGLRADARRVMESWGYLKGDKLNLEGEFGKVVRNTWAGLRNGASVGYMEDEFDRIQHDVSAVQRRNYLELPPE